MRYRDYKNFYEGGYFHIYNRGNNKQPIFLDDQDYRQFLRRISIVLSLPSSRVILGSRSRLKPLPENAFSIICYCLMPNHFHLLLRQNTKLSISRLMSKVSTSYAMYFNKKYQRVGSLFQDEFKSKVVLDDVYLKYLSAYIHNNSNNPEEYEFSSLGEYMGKVPKFVTETSSILSLFNGDIGKYIKFVRSHRELDMSLDQG